VSKLTPRSPASLNRLFTRTTKTAAEGSGAATHYLLDERRLRKGRPAPAPRYQHADAGMKSDPPWPIRGVRQQALEAAREAARRRGVSAGEWLDAAILDSALHQGVGPTRPAHPRHPRDQDTDHTPSPCRLDMTGDRLRGDLAEIGSALRQALPRRAIVALECEVRRLADRVDNMRHTDAAALARVERGVAEMRDALRTLIPAESLLGIAQALQQLSHRIDRNGGSAQDPAVLRQIEGALIAMRGIATRVASSEALEKLSDDVRGLAGKIDQAASRIGASVLAALEGRLAELADAVETRNRDSRNGSPEFEVLTQALIDKIERGQVAHGHSSLARLEELIGKLAEKLDACNTRLDRLEAIEQGLARLHAEYQGISTVARGPDSPPAPEIDELSRDVAGLRQAEKQTRDSLEAVHGTLGQVVDRLAVIETDMRDKPAQGDARAVPGLPDDHPPSSGSGAARGRNSGSPTDRVFNSEATPGPAKPSADTDCGGKSDFIAAARRAVRAAGEQDAKQDPAVSTSAGPAGRIGRLSALMGVATAVLAMLSGLQIARTLRSSADEAKVSALGQAATKVSPAPPASAAATIGPPAPHGPAPGRGQSAGVRATDGTTVATPGIVTPGAMPGRRPHGKMMTPPGVEERAEDRTAASVPRPPGASPP
jgi:hypothetical protein